MAFRAPRYSWFHQASEVGLSGISIPGTSDVAPGFPLARLIDDRRSVNFKFSASHASHYLQVDRSALPMLGINRLFIPTGHNFQGEDFRLRAAASSDMSGSVDLVATKAAPAGDIDEEFALTALQYIRLDWPSAAGQWELPELFLSNMQLITRGPEPAWTEQYIHNAITLDKANGEAPVIVTGPPQKEWKLRYRRTYVLDGYYLDQMILYVGIARPFLFDPPYDIQPAVMCRFVQSPRRQFDHPNPELGLYNNRYDFHLREVLE